MTEDRKRRSLLLRRGRSLAFRRRGCARIALSGHVRRMIDTYHAALGGLERGEEGEGGGVEGGDRTRRTTENTERETPNGGRRSVA